MSAHGVWKTQRLDARNIRRLVHSRVCQLMLTKGWWRLSSSLRGLPHVVSVPLSKELSPFILDLLMSSYFVFLFSFFLLISLSAFCGLIVFYLHLLEKLPSAI